MYSAHGTGIVDMFLGGFYFSQLSLYRDMYATWQLQCVETIGKACRRMLQTEANSGRICYRPTQSRSLWNDYSSFNADGSNDRCFDGIAEVRDPRAGSARQPCFEGGPTWQTLRG